jgi:hypothetical protein
VASVTIPNPLERRHLLERELDAAQALRYAEAYMVEDRTIEAVDFFEKAGATDRLEELAEVAIAAGDTFLFKRAADALKIEPGVERWKRLAAAAEAAGFTAYAMTAQRHADIEANG